MIVKIATYKHTKFTNILAGDIGATKTNLAIYDWNGKELCIQKEARYKTKSYLDITSMIRDFLTGQEVPQKICLGVAGPVQHGKANLTNIGWNVDSTAISNHFSNIPVVLINDLEAMANGLAVLNEKDTYVLHEGATNARGNIAIIAPGTGLGEAGLFNSEEGHYPFATEGGHCDFAPRTDMDMELYHFLKRQFDHVSWERVVSGPGICAIYDFLLHEKEREEPAWLREKLLIHDKASVITEHATACEICKETTNLFIRYLAQESANLVLKLKATGGLFIGGGIVPHLVPVINNHFFLHVFTQSGRLKDLLKAVPVKIIVNEKAPLLGAVYHGFHA